MTSAELCGFFPAEVLIYCPIAIKEPCTLVQSGEHRALHPREILGKQKSHKTGSPQLASHQDAGIKPTNAYKQHGWPWL